MKKKHHPAKPEDKHSMSDGFLLSVEGIDGSGKTTLAYSLAKYFEKRGKSIVLTKEPGGTAFGKHLRRLLHDRPEPINAKSEYLLFTRETADDEVNLKKMEWAR